ncbi:MAG: hypothetical protein ABEK02_09145 [Haloquadratum sp.]
MTASAHNSPISLDLTREEAWVVHAALVDAIEELRDDDEDPAQAVAMLRSVEGDATFEPEELDRLAEVLRTYAESDVPSRDRQHARDVVDHIEAALE